MSKTREREFKVEQKVYLVDCWGTGIGPQAFKTEAMIVYVNPEDKTFAAVLYGDTYQTYSFEDYGRLIFDTAEAAKEAADKLPKPKSVIYQIIGRRVYKKVVQGITAQCIDGVYDLMIHLSKGKDVSTKEIGISLFFNESDARQNKK